MHLCSIWKNFFRPSSQRKGSSSARGQSNSYAGVFSSTHHEMLRRFLGIINFYCRFIPGAAKSFAPLHFLLSPHKHSHKNVEWNETAEASFIVEEQKLADTTMLAFFVLNAPTQFVTDASDPEVTEIQLNHRGRYLHWYCTTPGANCLLQKSVRPVARFGTSRY